MEAQAQQVQQQQSEDDQQEVIYLVVDENQQGQQVTQIVSDGQLLGQQAQIIMQDGKQAVLITEGSEQQVVLLDDEVGPEAVQTALQQGALQQHLLQQQSAASVQQVVTQSTSVPATSVNGSQMQYLMTENGQLIMSPVPNPSASQPAAAQHHLMVTSAGLVRMDGGKSKGDVPHSKSLVNPTVLQEAAKSLKQQQQTEVVVVPETSPQLSNKPTLRELIHHTVDTQISEMQREAISPAATTEVVVSGTPAGEPISMQQIPTSEVVVSETPVGERISMQQIPTTVEEHTIVVDDQDHVDVTTSKDETDTMPFTEGRPDVNVEVVTQEMEMETAAERVEVEHDYTEAVVTSSEDAVDTLGGGDTARLSVGNEIAALTALPEQVMQGDDIKATDSHKDVSNFSEDAMEISSTNEPEVTREPDRGTTEMFDKSNMLEEAIPKSVFNEVTSVNQVSSFTSQPQSTIHLTARVEPEKLKSPATQEMLTPTTVITVISPTSEKKRKIEQVIPAQVSKLTVKAPVNPPEVLMKSPARSPDIFIKSPVRSTEVLVKPPVKSPEVLVKPPVKSPEILVKPPVKSPEVLVKPPVKSPEVLVKLPVKSPEVLVKLPVKSPEVIKTTTAPIPVSIASGRERRTSKPTRYYGLDSDYEMDQPDIYRSYRQDSESGEDKSIRKKTESQEDSQSSDFQSGDEEPQRQKKGRGRPRKSDSLQYIRMATKPVIIDVDKSPVKTVQIKVPPTVKQLPKTIAMVKDSSDEKSSSEEKAPTPLIKKGRGRPRKALSTDEGKDADGDLLITNTEKSVEPKEQSTVKRGRGRPPKIKDTVEIQTSQPDKSKVKSLGCTETLEESEIGRTEPNKPATHDEVKTVIVTVIAQPESDTVQDVNRVKLGDLDVEQEKDETSPVLKDAEIYSPNMRENEITEEVMQIDEALELNAVTGELEERMQSTPVEDLVTDPMEGLLSASAVPESPVADQNELEDSFQSATGSDRFIVAKFNDEDDNDDFHSTELIVKQSPFKEKKKSEESFTKRRSGRPKGVVSYRDPSEEERDSDKGSKMPEQKHDWLNSEVASLKQEIGDLKFLNESLQNRLGQESGSPEEVRALQGRIDKLQTTNNELRSRLKGAEPMEKKIGINLKQGMKFSFHKGASVTANTTQVQANTTKLGTEKNTAKQREIELAELDIRARENAMEKKELKLKALDRELDERNSQLTIRESKLDRWERKLKSQDKEIEYKEKQHKRFENDFRELGGSGSSKSRKSSKEGVAETEAKLQILAEATEDLEKKEADIAAREKLVTVAEEELNKLHADLKTKAEYLKSKQQSKSSEDEDQPALNGHFRRDTPPKTKRKSIAKRSMSPATPDKISSRPSTPKSSLNQPLSTDIEATKASPRSRMPSRKVLEQAKNFPLTAAKRKLEDSPQMDSAKKLKEDNKKSTPQRRKSEDPKSAKKTASVKKADIKSTRRSESILNKISTPKTPVGKTAATKKTEAKPPTSKKEPTKTETPTTKVTPKTPSSTSKITSKTPSSNTPIPKTRGSITPSAKTSKPKTPKTKTPNSKTATPKTPASKTATSKTPSSTKVSAKTPTNTKGTPKPSTSAKTAVNSKSNVSKLTPKTSKTSTPHVKTPTGKKTSPKKTPSNVQSKAKKQTPKSGGSTTPKAQTTSSTKNTPKSGQSSKSKTPVLKSPPAKSKSKGSTPGGKKSQVTAVLKRKRISDSPIPSKVRRK